MESDFNHKQWLNDLLSQLHKIHMKSLGFKKERYNLIRENDEYTEIFNIQCDKWNSDSDESYGFYLNVGIRFHNLEKPKVCVHIPDTHWAKRPTDLFENIASYWSYTKETDPNDMMKQLIDVINKVSNKINSDMINIKNSLITESWI
jgi:uncharacterized protein DUF4304